MPRHVQWFADNQMKAKPGKFQAKAVGKHTHSAENFVRGPFLSHQCILQSAVQTSLEKQLDQNKSRGLPSTLSFFATSVTNQITQEHKMLDSFFHMTLKVLWSRVIGVQSIRLCKDHSRFGPYTPIF